MRAVPLLVLLAFGCRADVDYGGTEFLCSDGETCPPGFACSDGVCVTPGGVDAGAGGADAAPGRDDDMVRVPAGEFTMGCDGDAAGCPLDTEPAHAVFVSEFEIDRTEVTQAAYSECVAAGACSDASVSGAGDLPVVEVAWEQASAYCAWAGKRLPTEAEWEKAARGTDGRAYPWGDSAPACNEANHGGCSGDRLPAGDRADGASPYGALDMAGNAAEWVRDRYDDDYYEQSPPADPAGPEVGSERAVRGGSFDSDGDDVRAFARDSEDPDDPAPEIGFRCAR